MMTISIVIPTYNRAERLRETLASIATQRYCDLEVIVVDNGPSTDHTRQVVEMYEDLPAYHIPTLAQGQVFARNIGASRACGQILLQVDDDIELLDPCSLQRLHDLFSRDHRIGIVGSIEVQSNNETVPVNYGILEEGLGRIDRTGRIDTQFKLINGHGVTDVDHVRSAFMAIRRACFDAAGGFDEIYHAKGMQFRAETDLCLKVKKRLGQRVVVDPGIKIWHKGATRTRGFLRGKGKEYFYYSNRNHVFFMHRFFWRGSLVCLTRDIFIGSGRTRGLYLWGKEFVKSPRLEKIPLIMVTILGKLAGHRMFSRHEKC